MEYILFTISIISCVLAVSSFFIARKDKAVQESKDNNRELIDIEVFKTQLTDVKDDVKEMKTDLREIKQLFITYKDDMREIAKEVVQDIVVVEIQKHVEKYHNKEK